MKLKKVIALLTISALCLSFLAGCAGSDVKRTDPESYTETQTVETEASECFVFLEDGDLIEYPVEAYGKEFALPESTNETEAGEFIGWLSVSGIHQPGDMVVAEEFMSFTALRADPDAGTVIVMDSFSGGYSMMASEEEMLLASPYDDFDESGREDYFDHWQDRDGNTYEIGDAVTVEKGDVLILDAVYSTDLSGAYKVEVEFNTGAEEFDYAYCRYVKKGASIPLVLSIEPAGCIFDGWYDAPEGGNLLANDSDPFTPESDIVLYAHWIRE